MKLSPCSISLTNTDGWLFHANRMRTFLSHSAWKTATKVGKKCANLSAPDFLCARKFWHGIYFLVKSSLTAEQVLNIRSQRVPQSPHPCSISNLNLFMWNFLNNHSLVEISRQLQLRLLFVPHISVWGSNYNLIK